MAFVFKEIWIQDAISFLWPDKYTCIQVSSFKFHDFYILCEWLGVRGLNWYEEPELLLRWLKTTVKNQSTPILRMKNFPREHFSEQMFYHMGNLWT